VRKNSNNLSIGVEEVKHSNVDYNLATPIAICLDTLIFYNKHPPVEVSEMTCLWLYRRHCSLLILVRDVQRGVAWGVGKEHSMDAADDIIDDKTGTNGARVRWAKDVVAVHLLDTING
jgi:hypothetical protein